jgi:replicative DNA helicase
MMQSTYTITQSQLDQEVATMWDVASERFLLALLMKHPNLIVEAERLVQPSCFNVQIHEYIYRIMLFIYQQASVQNWPLNFDSTSMAMVARHLGPQYEREFHNKTDGLEQVRLIESVKGSIYVEQFQSIMHTVVDRATRIQMYRAARQVMTDAMNLYSNPEAVAIARASEGRFAEISMVGAMDLVAGKISKIGDEGTDYLAKCQLNAQYRNLFSLPLPGFGFLNRLMGGGLRRKGLTIIAARPKVGKSTLLLSWALDTACGWMLTAVDESGQVSEVEVPPVPVLYLDTEMSREEMYSRGLSHAASYHEQGIMAGRFLSDTEGLKRVHGGMGRLSNAPFYYCNVAGLPPHMLPSIIRQFRNQYVGTREYQVAGRSYTFSNPGMVVYDWMKLPDPGGLKSAGEHQLLGFLASTIKDAAAANDLPVVSGAQNNRSAIGVEKDEWEEMAESFVAGSDRLAQFCTSLMILRNITPPEEEDIRASFGPRPIIDVKAILGPNATEHSHNSLHYNQCLHYVLQRGGPDYRKGIPLHIHRGTATYTEVADPQTMEFLFKSAVTKKQEKAKVSLPAQKSVQSDMAIS